MLFNVRIPNYAYLFLSSSLTFSQVLEFIRLSLGSRRVNLLAVDSANSTIATKTYDVPVDETVKELTFSLAGKKTRIEIADSAGKRLNASSDGHLLLNLENIKIISVLVISREPLVVGLGKRKHEGYYYYYFFPHRIPNQDYGKLT